MRWIQAQSWDWCHVKARLDSTTTSGTCPVDQVWEQNRWYFCSSASVSSGCASVPSSRIVDTRASRRTATAAASSIIISMPKMKQRSVATSLSVDDTSNTLLASCHSPSPEISSNGLIQVQPTKSTTSTSCEAVASMLSSTRRYGRTTTVHEKDAKLTISATITRRKLFSAGISSTKPVTSSRCASSTAAQYHISGLKSRCKNRVACVNASGVWSRSRRRTRNPMPPKSSTAPTGQIAISIRATLTRPPYSSLSQRIVSSRRRK
eukprot:5098371-Prymnesium_polylepis.2